MCEPPNVNGGLRARKPHHLVLVIGDAPLGNDKQPAAPADLDDEAEEDEGGDRFQDVVWFAHLLQLLLLLTGYTYKHKLGDKKASCWRPLREWQFAIILAGVVCLMICE